MNFLAKRRFNYIDAFGLLTLSNMSKQNWFIVMPIVFVLLVLSVYMEHQCSLHQK